MTVDELVDRIGATAGTRVLVGIDGRDGVGKTTLAREIAKRLATELVSLDDYLNRNLGVFLDALRYDELSNAVSRCSGRIVLVEGVCLRAALVRCGLNPQLHVYVRRLTRDGRWEDEEQCCPHDPQELKQRELSDRNAILQAMGQDEVRDLGVHGELIDYHYNYRPFENADILIETRECHARDVY